MPPTHSQLSLGQSGEGEGGQKKITYPWSEPLGL